MNWLTKFMAGRYAKLDQLSFALLGVGIVLTVLGRIFGQYWLTILSYLPFLLFIYRVFSRNISKRSAENAKFLTLWQPVQNWFSQKSHRAQDEKYFRFYHCPKCKVLIKVPKNRGKIKIKCPKCAEEFIKKT